MAFKTFVPGTTLTAGDVNDYLMKQAVIVCTSSTRPSSPVDGMTIYQTDTDNTWVYDGATWMPTDGLIPIKPTSVNNGTATGNIITFSNVATVTINGVFTTAYNQYRIIMSYYNNSGTSAYSRLRACIAGTAQTTSYVSKSIWTNMGVSSVVWQDYDAPSDSISIGATGASTYPSQVSIDISYPATTVQSYVTGTFSGTQPTVANYMGMIGGVWQSNTAFDGFRIYAATGQNVTGEIRVYGYR